MYPLQQTFCRELSQIPPDGVLREPELPAQVFRDHLPSAPQDFEDVLFAMTGEHKTTIAWVSRGFHETARYCMFYPV